MTQDQIRKRLTDCHDAENKMNKEMSDLYWQIKTAIKRREKLFKQVSKNMKYRNSLINKLK